MSEKLLESDGLMTNLRDLFNKASETTLEKASEKISTSGEKTATESPKADPLDDWTEKLVKLGFTRAEVIKKLHDLGEPFKKVLEVLGFNTKKNPLLAFVAQDWVQTELLLTDLLNASTFRAIYNALVKRQVASSEFLATNNYNILYCRDLYTKSATEMSEYLELQKTVLKPNAEEYSKTLLLNNRKTFFKIAIKDVDQHPDKLAAKLTDVPNNRVPKATNAATKLNNLKLAKLISGKAPELTTNLSSDKQDSLVKQLQTPATKYAAILALALTTDSPEAKKALSKDIFGTLSSDDILNATKALASRDIMPKGKLNKADADALVAKIVSSLA